MSEFSTTRLDPSIKRLLKHYNLFKPLVRAEIVENSVKLIDVSEDEYTPYYKEYMKQHNINSDGELEKHLQCEGLDKQSLRWQIELPIRIKRHCTDNYLHKAEARFLSKKEQLDRVVYNLLRVNDGFLARELYLRINSGENRFEDLAAKYSEGPEAKTKGIVGPVPLNKSHPVLSEKLRTSRPGELLEPFLIGEWWLVARLVRYESARFEESMAEAMALELFQEWVESEVTCKLEATLLPGANKAS